MSNEEAVSRKRMLWTILAYVSVVAITSYWTILASTIASSLVQPAIPGDHSLIFMILVSWTSPYVVRGIELQRPANGLKTAITHSLIAVNISVLVLLGIAKVIPAIWP